MRLRLCLTLLFVLLLASSSSAFLRGGSTSAPSFNPEWAQFGLGAGGQVTAIYGYSDYSSNDTQIARTDTHGFYVREWTNNCVYGATVYAAPCWRQGFRASNVPGMSIDLANGAGGAVEAVACASNTNVIYSFWNSTPFVPGFLYVSLDKGLTWKKTTLTTTETANNGNQSGPFIACDPNNPDNAIIDTGTGGVVYTNNGTQAVPTFSSAITAVGTGVRHNVIFEYGSSSNVWISKEGTSGAYRSTTGMNGTFTLQNSGSPPAMTQKGHLYADKFGQIWAEYNGGSTAYRFASGAWNAHSVGAQCAAIAFDPSSASVGVQKVLCFTYYGQFAVSITNGTSWGTSSTNQTFSAAPPQPTWLNVANQTPIGGPVLLNGYSGTYDPSGNVYFAGGIGVWKVASGFSPSSLAWAADTLGIEQLVVNKVVTPAGGPTSIAVWDRGVFTNKNPAQFPAKYFDNNPSLDVIMYAWGLDVASNDPTVLVAWIRGSGTPATSTNQGWTWTNWANSPSTVGAQGSDVAALTSQKFVVISGLSQPITWTSNGGSTAFTTSTISGTPTSWATAPGVGWPLAADRLTADIYCAASGRTIYYSTNFGQNFALSGINSGTLDGAANLFYLRGVPGTSSYLYSSGGQGGSHPTNTHLWRLTKTTNPCDTATSVNANVKEVLAFGFGSNPPSGGSYTTTIYYYGWYNGTLGFWQTIDNFATAPTAINIPASQTPYPLDSMDLVSWVDGDPDIYGRVYACFRGSGCSYIDTQDACPYIILSNVVANQSLSGTSVSVQAIHSGKVPATGANLYVNGAQVGTTQTGSNTTVNGLVTTTYTFALNATANAGSKTLKIESLGNGCSAGGIGNSKSIPVTLSTLIPANDNAPMARVA